MHNLRRFIVPVLGLTSLLIALFYVSSKLPAFKLGKSNADVPAAKLFFQPAQISIPTTTNQLSVDVHLDSAGRAIAGADVLVDFDKNLFTLNSITPNTRHAVFKTFLPINASNQFNSSAVVSGANSTGTIEFGFVSFDMSTNNVTQPTAQNSNFNPIATLNFQVKSGVTRPASSTLKFKFISSRNTTDSNVVTNANPPEDILLDQSTYANSTSVISFTTNPTIVPSPTPSPTISPTPVTSTPAVTPNVTSGVLLMNFNFQTINSQKDNKTVRVIVKQGANQILNQNVTATGSPTGTYSASINNIPLGTYDVYLKGPAHLQKKISNVTVASTRTDNWTTPTLLGGDISGDNYVDISDYSILAGVYGVGTAQASLADLNFDGYVDLIDFSILSSNYKPGVQGE